MVITLQRRRVPITLARSDTMTELREKLMDRSEYADQVVFQINGTRCEENRPLVEYYGAQDGTEIHAVLPCRDQ